MGRILTLGIAVAAACCAPSASPGQAGHDTELLRFVELAHRGSRSLIRDSYCRVKFEVTLADRDDPQKSTQSCSGEYWHSPDANRLKVTEGGDRYDTVWKSSVREGLVWKSPGGKEIVAATRHAFPSRYMHRGDAWIRGLLAVNVPGTTDHVLFEDLVAAATRVTRTQRTTDGGRPGILVGLYFDPTRDRSDPWEAEVFFDDATNHLVRRVTYTSRGRHSYRRVEEVVSFKSFPGGLYFPDHIVGRAGTGDELAEMRSEASLSDIRLNQGLPADTFRLKFPDGVYMTDRVRNMKYQIDSSGVRTSAEKPLAHGTPPLPKQPAAPVETKESPEEAPRPYRWLLPFSVVVLCVGVALALRRRRRVE